MKNNWKAFETSAKLVKKKVKSLQAISDYLANLPGEGYMRDNISKNVIAIKDCKSPSLRRYIKLLDNYYYVVTTEKDRQLVLNKKIEIEKELNSREDGIK